MFLGNAVGQRFAKAMKLKDKQNDV